MTDKPRIKTRVDSVMEDPSAQAVAQVYADAFLGSVPANQVSGALEEFASFIDDVLHRHPEFANMLMSSMLNRDEKLALVARVVSGHASEAFASFLRVLAKHDRLELLPLILRQSQLLHEDRGGQKRVQVTSAQPLSDETLQAVRQSLANAFPFQPIIEAHTDPSLLGGLRIRIGDTVYDSSLRTRLKQLRDRLRMRSLHEIQSGRNRFSHPEGD